MADSSCNHPDIFTLARDAFRRIHRLEAIPSPDDVYTHIPTNPDALFSSARRHRIVGLLYAGGIVPPDNSTWKGQVYGGVLHATRMQDEAGRLWQLLSPGIAGLRLIKGPGLAHQAWPDHELRAYDDLDFRCGHRDYAALCNGLEQAGYRPQHADSQRNANLWHYGWGVTFFHPDGFMVEANHRLFPPSSPCPAKGFANGQPLPTQGVTIGEASIRIPTPAAHLLLACIHALWHGGERLAWVVDIAGLLVRHPGVSGEAARLAGRHGFARVALQAGIRIADTLFGPGLVDDQGDLPGDPKTGHRVKAAQDMYLAQLYSGTHATFRNQLAFQRKLLGIPQRIVNTAKTLSVPGDGDFEAWSLPCGLRPLYWLYRPLRGVLQRIHPRAASPARPIGSP